MSLVAGSKTDESRAELGEVDWTGDAREPADLDNPRQRSGRASQRITALGEMTGGIAHDFRNVLAVIESRQQELEPHAENANDLLRKLEMFLQYGAGPGLRILFDLAPDLPRCLIDPTQFNAAILNLVVNARDAMPAGGVVEIGTRIVTIGGETPRSHVRVRVRDEGLGMPPAVVRRIFDPYFTTKGETGTGLGLPQVHAFMKLSGGEVRVASEVGAGTTIDLLFPILGDPPSAAHLWAQIDRWVNEGGAAGEWLPANRGDPR